jgi:hypothetical protein
VAHYQTAVVHVLRSRDANHSPTSGSWSSVVPTDFLSKHPGRLAPMNEASANKHHPP